MGAGVAHTNCAVVVQLHRPLIARHSLHGASIEMLSIATNSK